jgi:type I restriction enzyme, R subunit
LLLKLPRRTDEGYELEDEVVLRFYGLKKISKGYWSRRRRGRAARGACVRRNRTRWAQEHPLSRLVDKLNDRFGTDFKQADQLFLEQVAETEGLKIAAQANTLDHFKLVFDRTLEGFFVDRMEGNEEMFDRIVNDPAFAG